MWWKYSNKKRIWKISTWFYFDSYWRQITVAGGIITVRKLWVVQCLLPHQQEAQGRTGSLNEETRKKSVHGSHPGCYMYEVLPFWSVSYSRSLFLLTLMNPGLQWTMPRWLWRSWLDDARSATGSRIQSGSMDARTWRTAVLTAGLFLQYLPCLTVLLRTHTNRGWNHTEGFIVCRDAFFLRLWSCF